MTKHEKISNFLKDNKEIEFEYGDDKELRYRCGSLHCSIPLSDTGDGEFKDSDKALYYLRWLKYEFELQLEKQNSQEYVEFLSYKKGEYWFKYKNFKFPILDKEFANYKVYKYNPFDMFYKTYYDQYKLDIEEENKLNLHS